MNQDRIQLISQIFKYLFLGVFAIYIPLHLIAYFGYDGHMALNGFELKVLKDPQLVDYVKLGFGGKVLGALINMIMDIFPLYIIYSLTKLFSLYEKGHYFLEENIKILKRIGLVMLVAIVLDPFHQLLITATVSIMANPPGQRIASVTVSNVEVYWVMTSAMIYLIAWIMDQGRRLQDEVQHTV